MLHNRKIEKYGRRGLTHIAEQERRLCGARCQSRQRKILATAFDKYCHRRRRTGLSWQLSLADQVLDESVERPHRTDRAKYRPSRQQAGRDCIFRSQIDLVRWAQDIHPAPRLSIHFFELEHHLDALIFIVPAVNDVSSALFSQLRCIVIDGVDNIFGGPHP